MSRKKTQEEFEKELKLVLPNIQVIGKYTNTNTKIHCKCLLHGSEFDALPINMLHSHNGCRKCSGEKLSQIKTKTHDQFVIDLKNVNPNIDVVGTYINTDEKVKVKCLIDGYEWNADPRKLLRGGMCPVCTNHKVMTGVNDLATIKPDLIKYFKNKIEATKYTVGSDKVVDIICPECGYENRIKIGNLSRFGFSCNGCYENKYGRMRVPYGYWNKGTMSKYLIENYPGYKLLDIERTTDNHGVNCLKALIKCSNENHDPYWAYWTNILSGYKCFQCSLEETASSGERAAEKIFKQYNINFIPQKRFDDCRDVYTLPFDFYLPDCNLIVEIMGEQHERPVEIFGGQEGFEKRIRHDKIKRDYLKQNNIDILDIWYYEFDKMEDLILNKINEILTIQN